MAAGRPGRSEAAAGGVEHPADRRDQPRRRPRPARCCGPGRFDRSIHFDLPSRSGRREIVDYYLDKKAHVPELDKEERRDQLAAMTIGYTPVMIEHLFDEALVWSLRDGRDSMDWHDVQQAKLTEEIGLKQPVEYSTRRSCRIATHEAGHAVVAHLVGHDRKLEVLSIVKRRDALGLLAHSDKEERWTQTRTELIGSIKIAFGGMTAEELFFGEAGHRPGGRPRARDARRGARWSARSAWRVRSCRTRRSSPARLRRASSARCSARREPARGRDDARTSRRTTSGSCSTRTVISSSRCERCCTTSSSVTRSSTSREADQRALEARRRTASIVAASRHLPNGIVVARCRSGRWCRARREFAAAGANIVLTGADAVALGALAHRCRTFAVRSRCIPADPPSPWRRWSWNCSPAISVAARPRRDPEAPRGAVSPRRLRVRTRLLFLFATATGPQLTTPHRSLEAFVVRWDAVYYLTLVRRGYPSGSELANEHAFFPLYPATVRVVDWVLPQGDFGAAVFVSLGAGGSGLGAHVATAARPVGRARPPTARS